MIPPTDFKNILSQVPSPNPFRNFITHQKCQVSNVASPNPFINKSCRKSPNMSETSSPTKKSDFGELPTLMLTRTVIGGGAAPEM